MPVPRPASQPPLHLPPLHLLPGGRLPPGSRLGLRRAYEPLPDWAEAAFPSPLDYTLDRLAMAMAFHAVRIRHARQAIRGWARQDGPLGRRMVESNRRSLHHHRRTWLATRRVLRRILAAQSLPAAPSRTPAPARPAAKTIATPSITALP